MWDCKTLYKSEAPDHHNWTLQCQTQPLVIRNWFLNGRLEKKTRVAQCRHSKATGAVSQCKDRLFIYGDFYYKDKTVMRPSYLYNGNPYTGKTAYLYWDNPQDICELNYLHRRGPDNIHGFCQITSQMKTMIRELDPFSKTRIRTMGEYITYIKYSPLLSMTEVVAMCGRSKQM